MRSLAWYAYGLLALAGIIAAFVLVGYTLAWIAPAFPDSSLGARPLGFAIAVALIAFVAGQWFWQWRK